MMAVDVSREDARFVPYYVGRRWYWQLVERGVGIVETKLRLRHLLSFDPLFGNCRHFGWADVINLHNLHGMPFNPLALPRLAARRPLVWTLHDMWAMTGHCGYPPACEGWLAGCGSCPAPSAYPPADPDRIELLSRVKNFVYSRARIELVTPSRWLAGQARRSPLLGRLRVSAIPNGLDTEVFCPLDRDAARRVLRLPQESRVILAGAFKLGTRRKGMDLLLAALRELRGDRAFRAHLLLFGAGAEPPGLPIPCTSIGYVENERMLAMLYCAADVFVLPTRADNLPNTLVESIACGTPCVSFRVGGVPEVVREGETGLLAEPEDAEDLARCIHRLLADEGARRRMSARCREVAEREYGLDLQAGRYLRLYEESIERRSRSS